MSKPAPELFDAFRQDHAVLGRGLHEIASALRARELAQAHRAAANLDRAAGAHIAFEEGHFYPALRALIGDAKVDRLYREHALGRAAVGRLTNLSEDGELTSDEQAEVLEGLELMQGHVAECGDLFGAMGRISSQEQKELLEALLKLRQRAPRWSELATQEPSA